MKHKKDLKIKFILLYLKRFNSLFLWIKDEDESVMNLECMRFKSKNK